MPTNKKGVYMHLICSKVSHESVRLYAFNNRLTMMEVADAAVAEYIKKQSEVSNG